MTTLAITSAGSLLYISAGVPATIDATGFGALSYTQVKEITDYGMIGPKVSIVQHIPVDTAVVNKLKTTTDYGTLAIKGARAVTDPGQILLVAAAASFNPYALKIQLQNGALIYAQVLVAGYTITVGTAGVVTAFDASLEVSGPIVLA